MVYDEKRAKQMQDDLASGKVYTGDELNGVDYNKDGKFSVKDVSAYQKRYADPVKQQAQEKYDAEQDKPIEVMPYASTDGVPIVYSDKMRAENPDTIYPDKEWQASRNVPIVDEAMQMLENKLSSTSYWDSKLTETVGKMENREDFKYDLQGDVLYQQYKEQFIDNADAAMRDTVGQVTSMTGGYGNTYAQTAGQQTYNDVMGGLNDIVPELYQLALDKYNAEGQELKDMASIYQGMSDIAYSRDRDKVNDAYREQELGISKEHLNLAKQDLEHGIAMDNEYLELKKDEVSYGRKQDEKSEALNLILSGVGSEEIYRKAGLSFEIGETLKNSVVTEKTKFDYDVSQDELERAREDAITLIGLAQMGEHVKVTPALEKMGVSQETLDSIAGKANTPAVTYSSSGNDGGIEGDANDVDKATKAFTTYVDSYGYEKAKNVFVNEAASRYGISADQAENIIAMYLYLNDLDENGNPLVKPTSGKTRYDLPDGVHYAGTGGRIPK